MAKYTVLLVSHANATVTVETDETDPERILEAAWENTPSICAQCGGWGRKFSLELGDEWEPVEDENGNPTIYKEDE
jgi:hypothetical protein